MVYDFVELVATVGPKMLPEPESGLSMACVHTQNNTDEWHGTV